MDLLIEPRTDARRLARAWTKKTHVRLSDRSWDGIRRGCACLDGPIRNAATIYMSTPGSDRYPQAA